MLSGARRRLVGRKIIDQNRDVLNAAVELFRQRIQGLFSNVDEVFPLHPLPLAQTVHRHRVASILLLLVIAVTFRDVSFILLFVLFLVWLFPKKDMLSRRVIRTVSVEALLAYSAHVHMLLRARRLERPVLVACAGTLATHGYPHLVG